jgi:hypothetical protein
MLANRTYVVEVSGESKKAFLDEHPEIRNALAAAEAEAKSASPSAVADRRSPVT